jgi:alkanesulfonate monooxygenase SsuD/methylene tetrahydromethanopterin reductase-like flavin-dependent oxidoreductase (luciferase family)
MVNVIVQLYPMLRAVNEDERQRLRPLGRNTERYQEFVEGLPYIAEAADDLGVWGISTIEHHFHSEGYEVGPNPGIMAMHIAGLTKRVRVGQLGYTMSAQNAIRIAEDTALLDQLTRGRCFVGFSRGYQARWTNVLGQHYGAKATLSPAGFNAAALGALSEEQLRREFDDDRHNRDVFEEQVDLVLEAWTKDSIRWNSANWQIPFPYDDGIAWPMASVTARLGAEGEVGTDGRLRSASVCPAPYTTPHPSVFVASNASQETVEYCARKGFVPTYFSSIGKAAKFGHAYTDHAMRAGRPFHLGQNQALVRWLQIADTNEAARKAIADYDLEIYKNLYRPLTPALPYNDDDPVQSVLDSGLFSAGTVDEVKADFVRQWSELPAEYVVLIYHYSQMPKEALVANLTSFMTEIKPELDAMTIYGGEPDRPAQTSGR